MAAGALLLFENRRGCRESIHLGHLYVHQNKVEAFARNHHIPLQWSEKDMKKKGLKQEDYVRPYGLAMERRKRFGVYFIFKVLEQGPTFRSCPPKYPTDDPHYRILKGKWSPIPTITFTFAMKCSAP
jgi:hypothetical protein